MMSRSIGILCAAIAFVAVAAEAQNSNWRTYVNARFGSRIDYPVDVFTPEPPPENGDGLRFTARDGATFAISAAYNVTPDTPQSLEYSLRHPNSPAEAEFANVTYRLLRGNILVLSGFRGDQVYYDKFVFTKDAQTIHHFAIVYPATAKSTYDSIVERMSKSMSYAQ